MQSESKYRRPFVVRSIPLGLHSTHEYQEDDVRKVCLLKQDWICGFPGTNIYCTAIAKE